MATAVKKTMSLPRELTREAEELARAEGKTLSAAGPRALSPPVRAVFDTHIYVSAVAILVNGRQPVGGREV